MKWRVRAQGAEGHAANDQYAELPAGAPLVCLAAPAMGHVGRRTRLAGIIVARNSGPANLAQRAAMTRSRFPAQCRGRRRCSEHRRVPRQLSQAADAATGPAITTLDGGITEGYGMTHGTSPCAPCKGCRSAFRGIGASRQATVPAASGRQVSGWT